jgi:hypothetical protein
MLLSQDFQAANGSYATSRAEAIQPNGVNTNPGSLVESSSIPVHPLGVKPLGNQYFVSGPSARQALGSIGCLPDEMILQLLEYLQKESLRGLGSTCRFLYAFCQLDELWKTLFLE